MALEKIEVVDRIEVLENGVVLVRTRTSILEDGAQISATFHRHSINPGEDYSNEGSRVQSICAIVHDETTIAAYQKSQGVA